MSNTKTLKKGNFVGGFIGEVRDELRQVTWPTRPRVVRLTAIVVTVTALAGAYLGGLDYLFTYLMGLVL
jgi:preprotein translocase SecE subunit